MASPNPKVARQLERIAEQGISVDFHLLDADGESREVGRARVQEYIADEHQLVIDIPTRDARPMLVKGRDQARIYYELKNSYSRFDTKVVERRLETIGKFELPVLVLEGPASIVNASMRTIHRVEPLMDSKPIVHWRPILEDRSQQAELPWLEAELADVSGRSLGFLVRSEIATRLRPQVAIEVSLQPKNAKKPIVVDSVVSRVDAKPNAMGLRSVGLEFQSVRNDPNADHPEMARFANKCERENAYHLSRVRMGPVISDLDRVLELLRGSYHSGMPAFHK